MPQVFISYRRADSQDVTGRIYDRLVEHFSADAVFKDVDDIPLGADFRAVLADAVGRAAAVLVVIGPTWASCTDPDGKPRLHSPTDFVRLEVEAALRQGLPVIPVLVGGARTPAPDELPDTLQPLAYRHGLAVRPDPDFNADVERLLSALGQWLPPAAGRATVNQALADLARERAVERIDREWADEREKYLVTVMKGQTIVDGQPTGGYPVREVPTAGGAVAGCAGAVVVGVSFGVVLGVLAGAGVGLTVGVGILTVGFLLANRAFVKAEQYQAAEAAYRKRRALALEKGSSARDATNRPDVPRG